MQIIGIHRGSLCRRYSAGSTAGKLQACLLGLCLMTLQPRPMFLLKALALASLVFGLSHCTKSPSPAPAATGESADLLIINGQLHDGRGSAPVAGGLAIREGHVVAFGDVSGWHAARTVDAGGLAVAPGFINTLSWATESLIQDGRSLSDLRQGVTLEVMGEGNSMGPLNPEMKAQALKRQSDIHYDIDWTTLGEYLDHLVKRGIATNVASFVGATTVRVHELGYVNRPPTAEELARMQALVAQAMDEGALGVGASLIYAPAAYAKTDELTALVQTAANSGGGYIAHLRSEGNRLLEALDELIGIARATHTWAEVYHLKAAGAQNWPKMQQAIDKISAARASGLAISADMYTYTAGATGLDAAMPPWVQEGGLDAWIKRLKDPKIRKRVLQEMRTPSNDWENLYLGAGSPDNVLLIGFDNPALKPLTGKTLAAVAKLRGKSPEETMLDLVIEDHSRVGTAYFLMSEDNVRLGLMQPWVSLGSDEASQAPEGPFLLSNPHPRAYGNFARFIGHYGRDEKRFDTAEAVRRLSGQPARNFHLRGRGCLDVGCAADVVIFDANTIIDHATFDQPQQFATGVRDVFVNGIEVLHNGEHTGEMPGQVVRGPGYRPTAVSANAR
jgi:N-acyl-D-amino-acid deacylase